MNDRHRIIDEARETLDRLNKLPPSESGVRVDQEDSLAKWKRNMPQPEPKARVRGLDTTAIDWDARIAAAVEREHEFMVQIITGALAEALADQRKAFGKAFEVELKAKMLEIKGGLVDQLERTLALVISTVEDRSKQPLDLPPLPRREVN
jgi:hypothetical protein